MSWEKFFIVFGCCVLTMLACRVIPLFLLKGRELPEDVSRALGFIPPAAFAALVANDLFNLEALASGSIESLVPLIAALPVVAVAWFTKSLIWSVVTGVAAFAALILVF